MCKRDRPPQTAHRDHQFARDRDKANAMPTGRGAKRLLKPPRHRTVSLAAEPAQGELNAPATELPAARFTHPLILRALIAAIRHWPQAAPRADLTNHLPRRLGCRRRHAHDTPHVLLARPPHQRLQQTPASSPVRFCTTALYSTGSVEPPDLLISCEKPS